MNWHDHQDALKEVWTYGYRFARAIAAGHGLTSPDHVAEDAAQMTMGALIRKHPEDFPAHPDVPGDTVPSKKRMMQYCTKILRQRVFKAGQRGRWLLLARWQWKVIPEECVWQSGQTMLGAEEIKRLIAEENAASASPQEMQSAPEAKASIRAEW